MTTKQILEYKRDPNNKNQCSFTNYISCGVSISFFTNSVVTWTTILDWTEASQTYYTTWEPAKLHAVNHMMQFGLVFPVTASCKTFRPGNKLIRVDVKQSRANKFASERAAQRGISSYPVCFWLLHLICNSDTVIARRRFFQTLAKRSESIPGLIAHRLIPYMSIRIRWLGYFGIL